MKGFAVFCIMLMLAPAMVFAGDEPIVAEEVVVTATKVEIPIEEAPGAITVITREEIKDMPATDILDVIRRTTGISLQGHGMAGRKVISIRGMESRHTLFLIDGKRIAPTDRYIGHSDFQYRWIPIEQIERIEIVRGPLSALYGSDAMGGVINIITRPISKEWTATGYLSGGFRGDGRGGEMQNYNLGMSGPLGDRLGISLTIRHMRQEDTPFKGDEEVSELEGKEIQSIGARLSFTPINDHIFVLSLNAAEEYRWQDGRRGGALLERWWDISSHNISLEWRGLFGETKTAVRAYRSFLKSDHENSAGFTSVNTVINDVIDGHVSFPLLDFSYVTIGSELRNETLEHRMLLKGEDTITHYAFFAQNEFEVFERLMLTAGIRYDYHEIFGPEISPRVYAVYELTDNFRLRAGYGHAFKAPTIKQISPEYVFRSPAHTFYANPDLRPETVRGFEMGAEYSGEKITARVFLFNNEIDDLIGFKCIANCDRRFGRVFTHINIAEARTRGIEVDADVMLPHGFGLGLNYTYLDAKDTKEDKRLRERPRHTANGIVRYTNDALGLTTNLRYEYIGSQMLSGGRGAEDVEVPGYSLWHFAVRKTIFENFELRAGVENIGNVRLADKSEFFNYEERGRFFHGGITATF